MILITIIRSRFRTLSVKAEEDNLINDREYSNKPKNNDNEEYGSLTKNENLEALEKTKDKKHQKEKNKTNRAQLNKNKNNKNRTSWQDQEDSSESQKLRLN